MVTRAKNSTLEATLSVVNVGTGMDVLVNEAPLQQTVIAKSIKAGTNVTITDDGSTLTINSTASGGTGGITGATNAGTGTGVASGVSGTSLVLKSLKAGPNISITSTADEVTVEATGSASGEANTASNVGTGVGVFKSKTGVDLALKSLRAGANVTITPGADDILISATAGSGTLPVKALTEFGAVGDGTTDNTTAFASAAAWIVANKRPVFIPAGHYKTGPFALYSGAHQDWCGFYGEDPKRTIIQDVGTSAGPLITVGSASMTTYAGYFKFANLTVQANGTAGSAFRAYDLAWAEFDNCYFQGGATAFECYGGVNIAFNSCGFQFATTGLLITYFTRAGGGWPNNIKLNGGIVGNNSQRGIFFDYGRQLVIDGTQIEGNGSVVGNTAHGGVVVGTNIGAETGTHATNAHSGLVCRAVWFEQNTGVADVYLQSGFNTLTDCMFWSQNTLVTNNVRVVGQKYSLVGCDFAQTSFTVGQPNVFEGGSVMAGNTVIGGDIPQITWSNQKTSMLFGNAVFAPTAAIAGPVAAAGAVTAGTTITAVGAISGASVTASGTVSGVNVSASSAVSGASVSASDSITSRSLNVAPLWNALVGSTPSKPLILFGYDATGSSPTIAFNRTMANNGTVVIVQPVAVVDFHVRAPVVTSVSTTGFSVSKDRFTGSTKSTDNYAVYWIAIGEEL